jgi:hypothetical protein
MFESVLDDFDASNALRFIETEDDEEQDGISNNDHLVNLYKDHLKQKNPGDVFVIYTTEQINISVNDRLEVIDVDSE